MSDFVMPCRADMRVFQRYDGDVLTIQSNELHFIRLSFVMDMDDNTGITGGEFLVRNIDCQHNTFMFFYRCHLIHLILDMWRSVARGAYL